MLALGVGDTDPIQRRQLARKAGRKEKQYIPDFAPFRGEKLWGERLCIPEASEVMGGAGSFLSLSLSFFLTSLVTLVYS